MPKSSETHFGLPVFITFFVKSPNICHFEVAISSLKKTTGPDTSGQTSSARGRPVFPPRAGQPVSRSGTWRKEWRISKSLEWRWGTSPSKNGLCMNELNDLRMEISSSKLWRYDEIWRSQQQEEREIHILRHAHSTSKLRACQATKWILNHNLIEIHHHCPLLTIINHYKPSLSNIMRYHEPLLHAIFNNEMVSSTTLNHVNLAISTAAVLSFPAVWHYTEGHPSSFRWNHLRNPTGDSQPKWSQGWCQLYIYI